MRLRPMSAEEVEEKAGQFGRRQLLMGTVALAIAPPGVAPTAPPLLAPDDVFTVADLLTATAKLREANVPPCADGNYVLFISPEAHEDIKLGTLTDGLSYRVRTLAREIQAHEQWRRELGKRGLVTADEVVARVERTLGIRI